MYLCTSWIRVAAEYIYSRSAADTRSAAVAVDVVVAVAFQVGQRPYQSLPALKAFVLLSEWAWQRLSLTHTHTQRSPLMLNLTCFFSCIALELQNAGTFENALLGNSCCLLYLRLD